jgi:hypothetical protein
LWAQNGVTDKVKRRVPSCLDVAFSVLANNHIVPELVQRISASPSAGASHMAQWRDGRPYHHNLAAVRNVIDSQDPAVWDSNIYMSWLATLRKLSNPTTDPVLPQAMRTRAWALKSLNTQLASWTQLRHNTILYAKPSYTSGGLCSYPDAYVELRPGFWGRLERMATNTADMIQALPYEGTVPGTTGFPVELSRVKTNQVGFLRYFAGIVAQLRVIAEQELRHELLSPDQLKFINGWVESPYTPYNGVRRYNGWYPRLFYRHLIANYDTYPVEYGEMKYDALVVDVHNDIPDAETGDPGGILHEAVGKVNLLMIAIDSGQRRRIYAGPVLSHYEFETTPYGNRKTDAEWKEDLRTGNAPPPPPWTRSFLVP